jgi:hypothetical protein
VKRINKEREIKKWSERFKRFMMTAGAQSVLEQTNCTWDNECTGECVLVHSMSQLTCTGELSIFELIELAGHYMHNSSRDRNMSLSESVVEKWTCG